MNDKIFVWKENDATCASQFETIEEAQSFIESINNRKAARYLDPVNFIIGTEADYNKAIDKYVEKQNQQQLADFTDDVNRQIAVLEKETQGLQFLKPVLEQFDNKVLNKRFHDAVKKETGFYSSFDTHYYSLTQYDRTFITNPIVNIWYSQGWNWKTGDRLNATEAIKLVDTAIADRIEKIEDLKSQPALFLKYISEAHALSSAIKAFYGKSPRNLVQYARAKHLVPYCNEAGYIFHQ